MAMKKTYIKPKLDILIDVPNLPGQQDGVNQGNGDDIIIGGNDSEIVGGDDNGI